MARRDRQTLKNFFADGTLPTGADFEDLVDSTVNQVDDGFDKTPEDGLKIAARGQSGRLISLYPQSADPGGRWVVGYAANGNDLEIRWSDGADTDGRPVLTLLRLPARDAMPPPQTVDDVVVDVHGTLRAPGRLGVASGPSQTVPADGTWQPITPVLTGCQALEVVAGFGEKGRGHYALVHAFALNAFNPTGMIGNFLGRKKRIRCQHAYYGSRGDKLQLRWRTSDEGARSYALEIRSRCGFRDVQIQYFVTHLWGDPGMAGSASGAGADPAAGG